ncbi:MAG: FAD:protein FMN transferase [Flavobacteriaceae bacterium]
MRQLQVLLVILIFAGCKSKQEWIKNQNTGNALGTTYSIIYISDQSLDVQKEIDSVFRVINKSLSTYIPDSDISKINNGDTTIVVDQSFRDVYFNSQVVNLETDGYFDPTVGVLVNAWGFGPGKPIQLDSTKVDSLMEYVGWAKVGLKRDFTIEKTKPEIRFDFNAIAKGYTIDRLGRVLDDKHIDNYLVELGGEVLTKGINKISLKPWTVGIDDPENIENRGGAAIIHLKGKAMASSGNYRKFRVDEKTGKKYVHTVNPKTGYTKNSNVLSATVIAKYCMQADAFATAFMTMNLEDTKQLLASRNDLDAFIIYIDEQGKTVNFMTEGFKEIVVK